MSTTGSTYNFKVVLLGEGCVGKTSLLLRYIEDKFNDKHLTTLQATFLNKKININGKRINLSIWDTAGQEKFHALGPIYYRNSNGAILVYDITDEDSFGKVKNWVKELKKMLGSNIVLIIAGNKIDLEHERTVPLEEAESYANMVGAKHYYTSAKLNQGVEDLFLDMTREMLEKHESNSQTEVSRTSRVLVVDDEAPVQSSCCSGTRSN
ncbi:ras-related protein Rab-21-like [Galleria mellonella]|uniref:Ras-related protein Rab-21 n=1 Tax=Galleria mellonella TaxID=7137 RepID=A0A6J1WRR2_GALME|nr:ras-related protein Rab-21-like [Galleria mellonella]